MNLNPKFTIKCVCCNTPRDKKTGQWWHLSNYFGLSGTFCPKCYELVSHDAYRKPNHPIEYENIKNLLTNKNLSV